MPTDPSIPLMVRGPQFDPLGDYSRLLGVQAQRQQMEQSRMASEALAEQRQAIADQRRAQTDAATREQAESQQLAALFAQGIPKDTDIYRIVGPERGAKILEGLAAVQDKEMARYKDGRQLLGTVVAGLKALPEPMRAEVYPQIVDEFAGRGWLDASQIPPYAPGVLDQFERELMTADQRYKVDHPAPVQVSPGASLVDPQSRETMYTAPKAEPPVKPELVETVDANGRPVKRWVLPKVGESFQQYVKPEKPEGPDNRKPIAVMGPDGQAVFVPPSEAVGKRPANMREQGRAVTSGDAGRIAEFDTSLDDVAVLRDTIGANGATGVSAQIGAAVPAWVTDTTGIGTEAKQKQAVIDRVKQVIGKALEGGVLRKEDEYKYEKILPTIKDTAELVRSKLDGLEAALVQRRQRFIEALGDANYDVTNFGATPKASKKADPLGIR